MKLLVTGLAGLVVAFWGLIRDVGFIAQPFYAHAWWSYILALDGFVALKCGSSILTSRRRLFIPIFLWSVTFWYFFELLNLELQNWYYVGVFARGSGADLVKGPLFGVLCFGTVFTGLFETHEALGALGLFRRRRSRPRRFPSWLSYALQGVGGLMVLLSLLFSNYLAPLVWGSVTFLIDPWNYRHGARSLLGDLEAGATGRLARLLLSGLLCGLVWESFNYLAPQKWIYTVRGLEELKLFEMPLLGFLGFPALALDAFSVFAFVSFWLHGNETWESPSDVSRELAPRRPISNLVFAATLPLHLAFWGGVAFFMQAVNIGSVELALSDLSSLPAGSVSRLEKRGIERPGQLLRSLLDPAERRDIETTLGMRPHELEAVREEARLVTHKGIGPHHGAVLRNAGIRSVDDLAGADPDALFEALQREREREGADFPALRREMVRVWVSAARARSRARPTS